MKLEINKPCHENWDAMTPNEKGAFCLVCKKDVIDFTSKTLDEIKDFFSEITGKEKVCGRFEETQLKAITFDHFFNKFQSWKLVQKVALIVFFVFGCSLFGNAQNRPDKPEMIMGKVAYVPTKDTAKTKCGKDTTHNIPVKGNIKVTPDRPKKKIQPRPPEIMGDVMVEENRK